MDALQRHGIVERAKVEVSSNHRTERGIRMNITMIGIDLAKRIFRIPGVDERRKAVLRKSVKRAELTNVFANYRRA